MSPEQPRSEGAPSPEPRRSVEQEIQERLRTTPTPELVTLKRTIEATPESPAQQRFLGLIVDEMKDRIARLERQKIEQSPAGPAVAVPAEPAQSREDATPSEIVMGDQEETHQPPETETRQPWVRLPMIETTDPQYEPLIAEANEQVQALQDVLTAIAEAGLPPVSATSLSSLVPDGYGAIWMEFQSIDHPNWVVRVDLTAHERIAGDTRSAYKVEELGRFQGEVNKRTVRAFRIYSDGIIKRVVEPDNYKSREADPNDQERQSVSQLLGATVAHPDLEAVRLSSLTLCPIGDQYDFATVNLTPRDRELPLSYRLSLRQRSGSVYVRKHDEVYFSDDSVQKAFPIGRLTPTAHEAQSAVAESQPEHRPASAETTERREELTAGLVPFAPSVDAAEALKQYPFLRDMKPGTWFVDRYRNDDSNTFWTPLLVREESHADGRNQFLWALTVNGTFVSWDLDVFQRDAMHRVPVTAIDRPALNEYWAKLGFTTPVFTPMIEALDPDTLARLVLSVMERLAARDARLGLKDSEIQINLQNLMYFREGTDPFLREVAERFFQLESAAAPEPKRAEETESSQDVAGKYYRPVDPATLGPRERALVELASVSAYRDMDLRQIKQALTERLGPAMYVRLTLDRTGAVKSELQGLLLAVAGDKPDTRAVFLHPGFSASPQTMPDLARLFLFEDLGGNQVMPESLGPSVIYRLLKPAELTPDWTIVKPGRILISDSRGAKVELIKERGEPPPPAVPLDPNASLEIPQDQLALLRGDASPSPAVWRKAVRTRGGHSIAIYNIDGATGLPKESNNLGVWIEQCLEELTSDFMRLPGQPAGTPDTLVPVPGVTIGPEQQVMMQKFFAFEGADRGKAHLIEPARTYGHKQVVKKGRIRLEA